MKQVSSKVSNWRAVSQASQSGTEPPARPFVHATACPVEQWLEFLGHRWVAVILWHLNDGPLHPSELALRLPLPGIRPKALTGRLAALTAKGLVSKTKMGGFPPRVRYELASAGRDLLYILDQLAVFAEDRRVRQLRAHLAPMFAANA